MGQIQRPQSAERTFPTQNQLAEIYHSKKFLSVRRSYRDRRYKFRRPVECCAVLFAPFAARITNEIPLPYSLAKRGKAIPGQLAEKSAASEPAITCAPSNPPDRRLSKFTVEKQIPIKRNVIFGESFAHDIADINKPEASLLFRWAIKDKWKLLLTYDGEVNRYKTTHPRNEKRPQLFDLSKDPHEKINQAKEHPSKVAELVKDINSWYPLKERKTLTVFD